MAARRSVEACVQAVVTLYRSHGGRAYFGEAVTQVAHAAQTAECAVAEGHRDDVVCAAFLHDVGHLCAQDRAGSDSSIAYDDLQHELIGADFLRELGFSNRVVALVARHVDAKRFLTFKEPGYYQRLSNASRASLRQQGGPMSSSEARMFQDDPLFSLALELRTWDEAAKVDGKSTPRIDRYEALIAAHLEQQRSGRNNRSKQ